MSLEYSLEIEGLPPRWRCDSCTTQRHGVCIPQIQAWDALCASSKMNGFTCSPEAVEAVFSNIERNCQQSRLWQEQQEEVA